MKDSGDPEHGARVVQGLLDAETRAVPLVLRALGDAPLRTSTVARERYTSGAVADLEVARVWRRVWQMACRHEQIPAVGDCVVYESPGVSLVVVRSGPDEVRAFHNSCLHRGTQLRTQPGRIEELRCPFHGFTWNLDGSFAGMPCPWDFPHVDPATFCLPEARTGTWGGFVFVTVDPLAPSLEDYLEILPAHFASWDLSDRYLSAHVVRVVPCNWKVALEAFIESYHTVAVHPQLLTTSGDAQTQYDVYEGVRHVNRMITPVGIASDHVERAVGEQDILDAMFLTKDDADAVVPAGSSARQVLAERTRRRLAERTGDDYSQVTDCEALDAIEYFVFPNFVPWAGYTTPLAYRFRPQGHDHRATVMDVMLLEPVPRSGPRPAPAPTRHLAPGERWADAPELGYLGRILDQDTATLARVQHGLESAGVPDVTLARYQESRIRHFHATLTEYLQD
ncbi:MAG TPA: aromatic ring-hydroxylating dioxygenase subunit alpha [Acidimicrobiales bacterium]|nr:aromatic ring-hydroxylating dioxygenase subunit alpha [Acidimicrobiales bacterium]